MSQTVERTAQPGTGFGATMERLKFYSLAGLLSMKWSCIEMFSSKIPLSND